MRTGYSIIIVLAVLITGIFVVDKFLLQDNKDKISDQNLPKPDDFVQIKRDIQKGIFYDFDNLSKDYYLQPDFYPSYKLNSNHDYTRWGVHGYGAYPGEISYNLKNFKKGQYINIYTFIKAGDEIETFQGMKFDVGIVNGNHTDFDVILSPDTVMFAPTFPERSEYSVENRSYNWAYKLKITIAAKSDIAPGMYEFKLESLPPDENIQKLYYSDIQKINQKWYECTEDKKNCDQNIVNLRKKVYVNGGQIQSDKFLKIIINVGRE